MTPKRISPQTPEGGTTLAENPTYFSDPALDRVVNMVMELSAQVWVYRDRMMAMEDLLAEKGSITAADLDSYAPSEARRAQVKTERDAFINAVFSALREPTADDHN